MAKKESLTEQEKSERTKEFVKKNWPLAVGLAGAAGVIGAVVWMTARYLREKKSRDEEEEFGLKLIEEEAINGNDKTAILLETGAYLGKISGDEASEAAIELAGHIDDQDAKDGLEVLSYVTKTEK